MDKQPFNHFFRILSQKGVIPYALAAKIQYLIGRPIGISFMNGQGTSGVLCSAHDDQLYVYEYLIKPSSQ